jgi:hypothetical protein
LLNEYIHTEVFGDSDDSESLLHAYSATTLANDFSTLAWKTYDSEMTYTVQFMESTPEASVLHMNKGTKGHMWHVHSVTRYEMSSWAVVSQETPKIWRSRKSVSFCRTKCEIPQYNKYVRQYHN